MEKSASPTDDGPEPRRFCYDDTFALFVSDSEAPDKGSRPYARVFISDITRFQGVATKQE